MTPSASEQSLIEAFTSITDLHERLNVIVASCSGVGIPPGERRDADLVPGCVSRVWLTGAVKDGVLRLQWDADSPLVKGLAGLICRVYDETIPTDAAAHRTRVLSGLRLDGQLSPTRLNGLEMTARRIQLLAAGLS